MIHKFQKFLLILALGISSATAAQANGDIYSDAHGYIGRLEGTEIYSLANGYVGQIEGTEIYSAANGYVGQIESSEIYSTYQGYLGYVDQNGDWHLRSDWFLTNSSQRNLSLGERMRMAVPEDWVRQSGYPQGVQPPAPAQPQVRRAEPLVSRRPTSAQATAAINRAQDAWHEPRIKGGVRYDPATDTYNWIGPSGQARSKPASWFLDKFGPYL